MEVSSSNESTKDSSEQKTSLAKISRSFGPLSWNGESFAVESRSIVERGGSFGDQRHEASLFLAILMQSQAATRTDNE